MKLRNVRTIVASAVFLVLAVCLVTGVSTGTLCGFGWGDIALLCPLGAIETMIASRMLAPRALVSIVVMAGLVFFVGRAFCSWVCPVTVLNHVRDFFTPQKKRREAQAQRESENRDIARFEIAKSLGHDCSSCKAVRSKQSKLDSRHAVLGGAILSAAVFGFPVFCLVCPVGLSFATVLVVVRLFGVGDVTWSAVIIPAMLLIEVLFLRKWCTRFCPLSALMNLVGRFSRTTVPEIDNALCLETSKGSPCSKCASVCSFDINLRHPEYGELGKRDCSRCMDCVQECPAGAIRMVAINNAEEPFAVLPQVEKVSESASTTNGA
ncbi:quinol dehydrogenase membrane component [Slackia heliotrinireducens]|uniref:4Fe-4S binding protein n=1 Tax=Slackia heliotrinireducens TaxID=84110 RepID=UPI0003220181|nr:4Fe-4S binding protein [Slackia heliotrinireducens]VEH01312.1 quinol dehydrogenase membrane component [Slackia heliotrinireducens]